MADELLRLIGIDRHWWNPQLVMNAVLSQSSSITSTCKKTFEKSKVLNQRELASASRVSSILGRG